MLENAIITLPGTRQEHVFNIPKAMLGEILSPRHYEARHSLCRPGPSGSGAADRFAAAPGIGPAGPKRS